MTTPNGAPPDCRCAVCGTCYHDHNGWHHQWEMTTPNPAPTHTGLESPILVDTEAAAVYAGRRRMVIYRWAGEGRLTRYGTRGKGNALWDVRELTHWAGASCGVEMPPPPPVKPQNFQDRA